MFISQRASAPLPVESTSSGGHIEDARITPGKVIFANRQANLLAPSQELFKKLYCLTTGWLFDRLILRCHSSPDLSATVTESRAPPAMLRVSCVC